MNSKDARHKSPQLYHINTSSVSGPFWDTSDRCFWLMNNRQVYTHSENYNGSSACATIASANPNSAYPSDWTRSQRTRSLSGSNASSNPASHESKRIRPESFGGVLIKPTGSKHFSWQGTAEKQRKLPNHGLSNLSPPPLFPPQRSQSVRFSLKISYSDNHLKKRNPAPPTAGSPQDAQSSRLKNEQDQRLSRSINPSPPPHPSLSAHSHHKSHPTHTNPTPTPTPNPSAASASASASKAKAKPTSTSPPTKTHRNHPPRTRYTPPKHVHDPEHEDEDLSPVSSATSAHPYTKFFPPSPSPSPRDRHESHRIRTHHRRLEYDYDTDSEIPDQKEKKLIRPKTYS
ncbi:hypothetical protein MFRU_009g01730 [Monilinia fructicola]|nr:hypothetical protein MFRU_009g01730 [Monilinia fructicola]